MFVQLAQWNLIFSIQIIITDVIWPVTRTKRETISSKLAKWVVVTHRLILSCNLAGYPIDPEVYTGRRVHCLSFVKAVMAL